MSLEKKREANIAAREAERLQKDRERVASIKSKLLKERQERASRAPGLSRQINLASQSNRLYGRTRDEIIFSSYPMPTVSELLAELTNLKETAQFVEGLDLEKAAKAYGMKPFTYAKQLNDDATARRVKVMNGN